MMIWHSLWAVMFAGSGLANAGLAEPVSQAATQEAPASAQSSAIDSADDALLDPAEIERIRLQRDRYERITVPVTIAGEGPYRFLIDTGSQATAVTRRVVTDLALEPTGQATLIAMGSREIVETISLNGLEFANRRLNGITAPLLKTQNIGADGILGLDSLQDLRVQIDFRENRMAVADAESLGGDVGFEIVVRARRKLGQMIITNARVNGVRTAVVIDTGAQNSIGNRVLRRKLRARDENEQQTSTDVNGTELHSDLAFARKLTIGGLELSRVPIGFAESPVFAALGLDKRPALVLGMNNLRLLNRVAIDFSSREILFDLPTAARQRTKSRLSL
jgi:predicted aspartyl protease